MEGSKRLSQKQSQNLALQQARALLIEFGPQAVTLKAVAERVNRTHANLLHHFGSAAGLQKALAKYLAETICATLAETVKASRSGKASVRAVVDLAFDAFDKEGGGALASWMLLSGNEDALNPVVEAIHNLVEELGSTEPVALRACSQALVLMALGDALMGAQMANSFDLPRTSARDTAEAMLIDARLKAGLAIGTNGAPSLHPETVAP